MKEKKEFTHVRKLMVLSMILVLICPILVAAVPGRAYAKDIHPRAFKTLKVGSKNLKKYANDRIWLTDGMVDGCVEIYLPDIKGKAKSGSRFKIKMQNGVKATCYVFLKSSNKRRKIKNNYKIKNWKDLDCIEIYLKKGKYRGYYCLFPYQLEE